MPFFEHELHKILSVVTLRPSKTATIAIAHISANRPNFIKKSTLFISIFFADVKTQHIMRVSNNQIFAGKSHRAPRLNSVK
jgi:hypothetical protein